MKIISHHHYWRSLNEIRKAKDAEMRGLLSDKRFLMQLQAAVKEYEENNPVIRQNTPPITSPHPD